MRRRIFWAIVGVAVCAVLILLTQRKAKPAMPADDAEAPAVSTEHRVRKAVVDRRVGDRPAPAGLDAAYAPGVVVITNGILEPDPRYNFDPGPGMADHEGWERYREEMRETAKLGEIGKATFHVVDTDGNSVAGADISARFFGDSCARGQTDADGLFTVEGRTLNGASLSYTINKQGFYQTRATYQLGKRGYRCLENGRWIPWNPTLRVTLKEIRKPIPMYTKRANVQLPLKNKSYGFDFLAGDLVEPDGKGKRTDVWLTCWGDKSYPPSQNYSNELLIATSGGNCGFVRKSKDRWSGLISVHEAPEGGYEPEVHLSIKRSSQRVFEKIELDESEYLIFKTVAKSENGEKETYYGKIYGPVHYGIMTNDREGAGVTLSYYVNPTPNDRNLEFDGKNNLFKPDWRDYTWPKEP